MTENTETAAQDTWAIVEIMGHSRYAGRVSQDAALGVALLRIDVPEVDGLPAFTKLFGAASIFAVTLCTEEAARQAAAQFHSRPAALLDVPTTPRLATDEFDPYDEP